MPDPVQIERDRCIRIVEAHLPNLAGDMIGQLILSRIANMIRNGEEEPEPIRPGSIGPEEDDDPPAA